MFSTKFSVRHTHDRLARLGQFLSLCGGTFCFFSFYYLVMKQHPTAVVTGAAALSAYTLSVINDRIPKLRKLLTHAFLTVGCLAIVTISLFTGGACSATPVFLCTVGLLAFHLLGIRAALAWTCGALACIFGVVFVPIWLELPTIQQHGPTDYVLNLIALTALIFFMSVQSEVFFDKHASRLFEMTEKLKERTRLLSLAEEVASVGHWRVDLKENKIRFSLEACNICGIDAAADEPHSLGVFYGRFASEQAMELERALDRARTTPRSFTFDLAFQIGGSLRYVTIRGISEQDSDANITAVFGIVKDDTDARFTAMQLTEKAAALHRLATFDPLTGLANRHEFQSHIEAAIRNAQINNVESALLLMDMDGFKEINDTLGHSSGDSVLRRIADRLQVVVPPTDMVARLGGDEFTVILNGIHDEEDVIRRAKQIAESICQPYEINGNRIELGVSIGAALCPTHSRYMDDLLAFADTAMYEAKANRVQVSVYKPSMTDDLIQRRRIEGQLAQAMARRQFHLVYQPQFKIDGKQLIGFEALLRWNCDGEFISPVEFIPILENSGAILAVGQWVIIEACAQAKHWVDAGHDISISVNISPVQFRESNFVRDVISALDKTGLDPSRLDLEVTEGVLIHDVENTTYKLIQLKELGISISIDDFGTGYSSFAYLKRFPLDRLKIDREFVRDIPSDDDGTIASSMVVLGHNLEMKVLAEGVETSDQLAFLGNTTCDECQGYLFSKPLSAEDSDELLEQLKSNQARDKADSKNRSAARAIPLVTDLHNGDTPMTDAK